MRGRLRRSWCLHSFRAPELAEGPQDFTRFLEVGNECLKVEEDQTFFLDLIEQLAWWVDDKGWSLIGQFRGGGASMGVDEELPVPEGVMIPKGPGSDGEDSEDMTELHAGANYGSAEKHAKELIKDYEAGISDGFAKEARDLAHAAEICGCDDSGLTFSPAVAREEADKIRRLLSGKVTAVILPGYPRPTPLTLGWCQVASPSGCTPVTKASDDGRPPGEAACNSVF